jgi:hypothetical protein
MANGIDNNIDEDEVGVKKKNTIDRPVVHHHSNDASTNTINSSLIIGYASDITGKIVPLHMPPIDSPFWFFRRNKTTK